MRKIFCDKCKKEVPRSADKLIASRFSNRLDFKDLDLDLCKKCKWDLINLIKHECNLKEGE